MTEQLQYKPGLEDIVASETSISYLDVKQEEIVIRGYDLIELAQNKTYLETAYLLIYGRLQMLWNITNFSKTFPHKQTYIQPFKPF